MKNRLLLISKALKALSDSVGELTNANEEYNRMVNEPPIKYYELYGKPGEHESDVAYAEEKVSYYMQQFKIKLNEVNTLTETI